jgi:hypothetical protein
MTIAAVTSTAEAVIRDASGLRRGLVAAEKRPLLLAAARLRA